MARGSYSGEFCLFEKPGITDAQERAAAFKSLYRPVITVITVCTGQSVQEWFDREWDACNSDPERAEGGDVFMSTYKHWVGYQKGTCAMYLQRCIPPGLRRQLTKKG